MADSPHRLEQTAIPTTAINTGGRWSSDRAMDRDDAPFVTSTALVRLLTSVTTVAPKSDFGSVDSSLGALSRVVERCGCRTSTHGT